MSSGISRLCPSCSRGWPASRHDPPRRERDAPAPLPVIRYVLFSFPVLVEKIRRLHYQRGERQNALRELTIIATDLRRRPELDLFIRANLPVASAPFLPEIRLHKAHPSSGLWRLAEMDEQGFGSPYWAYPWAGGLALARHILDRPETVAGRRVLDLGAGSGVVAIAAAKAGASEAIAAEIDPYAIAALGLNAAQNGVAVSVIADDLTGGPPFPADLVAVGDLFYERGLAARVTAFLDRCIASGIDVLIGDPGRAFLPRSRLRLIAEYAAPDVGEAQNAAKTTSAVFSFEPDIRRSARFI